MSTGEIILSQKLRTKGLVILLSCVWVVVMGVTTYAASVATKSSSTIYVVEAVMTLAIGTAVYFFSSVVASVRNDSDGPALVITYGLSGKVNQVFTHRDIVSGVAARYSFAQMGGYGYRGSLKLLRRAALATRSGDALDLRLTGKRRFIVTVDDPKAFLEALTIAVG